MLSFFVENPNISVKFITLEKRSEIIAGATTEYEASPTPTKALNARKPGNVFMKEPINVARLQKPEKST